MYKSFSSLEELFAHLEADKNWTGAEAGLHNRYPIRFVLFDNFADFNEFIVNRPDGIYKYSIETMIDQSSPDSFLTYTELSRDIRSFTKKVPANDFVIYPFSEMARFYDNSEIKEFDALIKTIRGEQAPEDSQEAHVRLYIPIVGMQGKMGKFMQDNITFVWEYKSGSDKGTYNLVITDGTTYGVSGLNDQYTVVSNLYEWLKLWEKGENIKQTIICSSPNIFINSHFAQPDNAFVYQKCQNAYEFLTKGLHIDFGIIDEPSSDEIPYWEQLASEIDINTFNFEEFVKERLDTFALNNGYDFIKSWFDCETDFDRWLLSLYFRNVADKNSYIYKAVCQCANLTKSELFSTIATLIFDEINMESFIQERLQALKLAAEHDVNITEMAKQKLTAKLSDIASSPDKGGCFRAVRLLTPFTDEERQLAIKWVSQGKASLNDIQRVFPQLYSYLQPFELNSLGSENQWIKEYFNAYRWAKLGDTYTEQIRNLLYEKNASPVTFQGWKDNFKTVKTILHHRNDIDVIYWIDGLGVEWVPFIRSIIDRYAKEHVYLNEIHIGVSDIPTTTSVNRPKLESLLPEGVALPKIGDIDKYAHTTKKYPQYIIEEMKMVENAIAKVLDDFNDKKIAFVSDHGITYLSQLVDGLEFGGIEPNHEGRCGNITSSIVKDNKYVVLDDGQTVCSLTHHSLSGKVDKSHGAHGGCTPEELLVPIIIVSPIKNANSYSVNIVSDEIDGTNPYLKFTIRGLSSVDIPSIKYNGVCYQLSNIDVDTYQSERINLVDTATKVTVFINGDSYKTFGIKISTGAKEDDLFSDF